MAIQLPISDTAQTVDVTEQMSANSDNSSDEFDWQEHYEMETQRIKDSVACINWKSIYGLQLALNYVELADRNGRSTSSIDTGKEVGDFLNDVGIVLDDTTLTWPKLDCHFHSLAYDILHAVKFWHCDMDFGHANWFCDFLCPLDVNREHLIKICDFLLAAGLKIWYHPTENRVIQRLVLFIASPTSWENPDSKLRTIDQLRVST